MAKSKHLNISGESPEVRKKINDAINEIVAAEIRKKDATSYIADVKDTIEQTTGMPKDQLAGYAKLRYLQENEPEKYEAQKNWFDSCFEENEMLND